MRRCSIPRLLLGYDTPKLSSRLSVVLFVLGFQLLYQFHILGVPRAVTEEARHQRSYRNRVVTATPLSDFRRLRTPLLFAVDILGLPRTDRSNLDIFYSFFLLIYSFPFFLVSDVLLSRFCLCVLSCLFPFFNARIPLMFSAIFARISFRSFLFLRPFFDQGLGSHMAIRQRYGRVYGTFLRKHFRNHFRRAVGVTSGNFCLFAGMSIRSGVKQARRVLLGLFGRLALWAVFGSQKYHITISRYRYSII